MTGKKVSLIVITYNQLQYLRELLVSVKSQTVINECEVIIVNDCSTDGTIKFLEDESVSNRILVVNCENNVGRAAARNLGAAKAQGDILIFIDGDMIIDSKFLEEHIKFHNENMDSVAIGRIVYRGKNSLNKYLQTRGAIKIASDKELPFRYFVSGNFSIKRTLFNEFMGFDEEFDMYGGEDLELGYRLHTKGVKIKFIDTAVSIHIPGPELKEVLIKRHEFGFSALPLFARKHPGVVDEIPIYRIFQSGIKRIFLAFIFNSVFYNIVKLVVLSTIRFPFFVYDYLIYGSVFKGLNKSRKQGLKE